MVKWIIATSSIHHDRLKLADIHADTAACTYFRIDRMNLSFSAADSIACTITQAHQATCTSFGNNGVLDQALAYLGRAFLIKDMASYSSKNNESWIAPIWAV
jgi:hypothetical protein